MRDTAFLDGSATALRDLVRDRRLSAVEVVEATLARVTERNPALNAVVTLNPRALDEARAVDAARARGGAPGVLCGLPVGIKDITPVAGLRTTYGSAVYADHVATEDALVVTRLREAGAVILGKTNCPEFAAGGNTFNDVFGRTRNPWDPSKSAGGSTGGGAAALAAGMIALAEGTDLGGSLRIPASFCGVVGIRPSVGLVPTVPTDWLWDTLQVTGPMARTAADVALALQVMAGPSARTPITAPFAGRDLPAAVAAGLPRGTRVRYAADPARIGVDVELEGICRRAAFGLEASGHLVEEIDLDLAFARPAFLALRGLWFVAQMHPRFAHRERFGANVAGNITRGLETPLEAVGAAEQARNRLWRICEDLFAHTDLIVTPTMAVPPFPVEQNYPETIAGTPMETYIDWIAPTFIWSLTGLPVASVPCGRDARGLPVGLQIIGPPMGEERVLALAGAIETLSPLGPQEPAGAR
ncbi:MAG: amidase [Vicinamibacterales bacterium]|nr:amidase [Vicinamibacterales bacterium]